MTSRFTRRCCTTDKYRVPLLDGQEVYFVEASHDAFRLERNTSIPDAYFGDAINRLGEYEDLGYSPEELKKLIEK